MRSLASYIDHTILKADATTEDIGKICAEAIEHSFASVCVNPCYVKLAKETLKEKALCRVTSVIGFPLGANRTETKVLESKLAIEDGADELDMVINIGALKSKDYDTVKDDILKVQSVCKRSDKKIILKIIIETSLLTEDEKVKICEICRCCGVDFVKTSTGFSSGGATVEDVSLMKGVVGDLIEVKASGGIRTFEKAKTMISAGATRIGASASVEIVNKSNCEKEGGY